jgi:membrane protein implicated in regulation of membrane protease activity
MLTKLRSYFRSSSVGPGMVLVALAVALIAVSNLATLTDLSTLLANAAAVFVVLHKKAHRRRERRSRRNSESGNGRERLERRRVDNSKE